MSKTSSGAVKAPPTSSLAQQKPPAWISRHAVWLAVLALSLLVLGLYAPSLGFQFILDDHRFTADPRIQNSGHIWDYFTTFVWAQFTGAAPSFYRPVFLLWMRLNYLISELSPWGWHLLSIAKHGSVAVLLGLLAWKLLKDLSSAMIAALLFAFHPAQTESVSWVTVPDPLMAASVLCALYLYHGYLNRASVPSTPTRWKKARKEGSHASGPLWLFGSVAAFFAALLAKETAIILPAIIFSLWLRVTSDDDETPLARRLGRALAGTVPFLLAVVLYLLLRLNALDGQIATATQHLSWTTVIQSWPAILWFYSRVMLWPVRSYSFADPIAISYISFQTVVLPALLVLCFVGVIACAAFWIRRASAHLPRQEASDADFALIVGVLLLFLPLLPALNLNALNPGDFLHGRYTYLPLAGLMLIIASAVRFAGRMKGVAVGLAALVAVGYVPLTLAQQRQWKDDLTVFATAHELAPQNAPVARNLADARVREALSLEEDGRCAEAIPVFQQVSREYPDDWYPLAGLGYCYAESNDYVKAEEFLHRAADLSQDSGIVRQWQELRSQMGLPPVSPSSK